MRPILLKMQNFLSYVEEEFDFTQVSNATITGQNGAGKSSFCTDAITWALFGKGSRGSDKENSNYINTDANSCSVELSFSVDDVVYKVVRAVNNKNRMALNLFVVNKDGEEIPMSGARIVDTQEKIESLLRMTYRTFTASSMIFQGKSDEFTNGMSNAERKEAIINILNISEWDEFGELAKANVASLKKEIYAKENFRDTQERIIGFKKEYEERKKAADESLRKIQADKKSCEETIEKNQKAIFQRDEISKAIAAKSSERNSIQAQIDRITADVKKYQAGIERNNKQMEKNGEEIARQQKILERKEEIEEAVKQEAKLSEEMDALWKKQREYSDARANRDNIANDGKMWKSRNEQELKYVESRIKDCKKQAEALAAVPCSKNKDFQTSCPFLKMALSAKDELEKLEKEKEKLSTSVNPFTKKWNDASEALKKLFVDPKETEAKQAELKKVQAVSRLKPVMESAAGNIALLIRNNTDMETQNKESKARIEEIRAQVSEAKASMKTITEEESAMKKTLASYDEVYREQEQAKASLESLKRQEADLHSKVGSCEELLKQVGAAENALKSVRQEIDAMKQDLSDTELLVEACGKTAGVPALIVENAVPELETEANLILENMMDGRLQIRLDTQIETNKGTKTEVFRITVLDDGSERRYDTYSGAEKFVVDLSLRIAMSKFLSKRSGASVSLFVLDEGVSCADESNRDEIVKAIRSIVNQFDTVLFVTHIEEMKDALDQRIEVHKDGAFGSRIDLVA